MKKLFGLVFIVLLILQACTNLPKNEKNYVEFYDYNNEFILRREIDSVSEDLIGDFPVLGEIIGYTFKEWRIEIGKNKIIAKAIFEAIQYKINYIGIEDAIHTNPEFFTINDQIALTHPGKEGYVFIGWKNQVDDLLIRDYVISRGSHEELTLVAQWIDENELTFKKHNESEKLNAVGFYFKIDINWDLNEFTLTSFYLTLNGQIDVVIESGTIIEKDGFYELSMVDQASKYIKIVGDNYEFVKSDGTPYSEVNDERVIYDPNNLIQEYGYGYYDLTFFDNKVNLINIYMSILNASQAFDENGDQTDTKIIDVEFNDVVPLDQVITVYKLFLLDHPDHFWVSQTITVTENKVNIRAHDVYLSKASRDIVKDGFNQIILDLDDLIISGMNQLEISKVIHDYIIQKIDYAYEEDGVTPEDAYWAHNIAGVALGIGGVCEAYAESFHLLARRFGINTILVTGVSNNQNHIWNIIEIDGFWYNIDLTWNDPGNNQVSHVYFGASYERFLKTHVYDSFEALGIEYLYQLPILASDEITFVKVYQNDDYMGYFRNIKAAFELMTNEEDDFVLELFDYGRFGPLLMAFDQRVYLLPKGDLPNVNSITLKADIIDLGDGYLTYVHVALDGTSKLNSRFVFENIFLGGETHILDLANQTLSIVGNRSGIQGNIIGDMESTFEVRAKEVDLYGNISADQVFLYGTLNLRSWRAQMNQLHINHDSINYQTGSIMIVNPLNHNFHQDEFQKLDIQHYLVGFSHGNILSIQNPYKININIGKIEFSDTVNYEWEKGLSILVRVTDFDHYPNITIHGELDAFLTFIYISQTERITSDLNGYEIIREKIVNDLSDFDGSLLTVPDMSMDQIFISSNRDISKLYDKDQEGHIYRAREFYEEIIDGELLCVVSSTMIETYIVPDTVTKIGENAFVGAHLLNIIIPEGVSIIGRQAFVGQTYLRYIKLPDSITEIHEFAFSNTFSTIELPTQIEYIAKDAFGLSNTILVKDSHLNPIDWNPEWVYDIPFLNTDIFVMREFKEFHDDGELRYALSNLGYAIVLGLSTEYTTTDVVIPKSILGYEVIHIASAAFMNSKITSVVIPNSIESIGPRAFYQSNDLKHIVFEENSILTSFGYDAFANVQLDSIIIPSSVIKMGSTVFYYPRFDNVYTMKIYSYFESKPEGWSPYWNEVIPVVWGYQGE